MKQQTFEPPPLSIRISQVAFDLALDHSENVGITKGVICGIFCGFSFFYFRRDPLVVTTIVLLLAVCGFYMLKVWNRSTYFRELRKTTAAMAEEFDLYLRATNVGTIVKSSMAEVAADEFVLVRALTEQELASISERAYAGTKRRADAIQKLSEAAVLIDQALEHWIGRYPCHTLQKIYETLEALRIEEERRTMVYHVAGVEERTKITLE